MVSGSAQFSVLVEVRLREGIADPQGATIERALPALGLTGVTGVRASAWISGLNRRPKKGRRKFLSLIHI